ncbi:redoxin domain-containing protein [Solwaraspora sp. WMMD1047]|uniref:redoxin domain-containing protein n=1 Tax=Solwaraspora sp. WMMD1047 TaxID=3016102 RepID=UPI00241645AF|nr:redoxin domain-containing protein [Solwaraspora sp. WMMD1047]MDG4832587.1 redoxin domain-containing protein [Solwaraspora sp. WMMD1047]
MRSRPAAVILLAAALFATAACAGGRDPAGGDESVVVQAESTGGSVAAPVPVADLLKFDSRTLDGQAFNGASLAGRPTVLWFWAPWCATCAGQAASIRDMFAAHAEQVNIVGVAGLGDEKAMREFVAEFELAGVTQLNDQTGEVWRRFEVTEQSTYVFLDGAGRMTHRGWLDSVQFESQVAAFAAG